MSWLFSQALVAAYSADTCSDGEPYAQWSVMPTPQGFWRNDKMMEPSNLSRFGPKLRLLTADHGEAVLMSFLAAFPVRTSVLPERVPASRESDQDSGPKWRGWYARYDPATCSWRTAQRSLVEDWETYSETWPRSGMTVAGHAYLLPNAAAFTYATESGFMVPTPGKNESKGARRNRYSGSPEFRGTKMSEALRTCETDPIYATPCLCETVMMWPLQWTVFQPLAMDKFQLWQRQHGRY